MMKKGILAVVVAGALCVGCASTQHGYRTAVSVSPSETPGQYKVVFNVSEGGAGQENDAAYGRNTLKLIVEEGKPGELKMCDADERDGIIGRALVKDNAGHLETATTLIIKADGRELLNCSQLTRMR